MVKFPKKLEDKMKKRVAENTVRMLPVLHDAVDFASNDYLGFARNTKIFKEVAILLSEKNITSNGATGSRLISGNHSLFQEVELYLATWHSAESALLFNSGYDANIGFFSAVPQRGDIIFYDELIHASIRDGIQMGTAKSYKFRHNDLEDLQNRIKRSTPEALENERTEIYIVTEAVFSMDGDIPDLKAFGLFCEKNKYQLIVDEAHAIGIFGAKGEGLIQELGIAHQVFARIITFGKAMGCHGAAILGSETLKKYLLNFARSFIYTTALPPHSLATVFSAYTFLESAHGQKSKKRLLENISFFKEKQKTVGLKDDFIGSNSAIQSCIVPGNSTCKTIAKKLQEMNFDVKAILSPTVQEGKERLRFCIHSYTKKEEIKGVLTALSNLIK